MTTKLSISTPPRAGVAALGAIAALIGTATSAQAITFGFNFDAVSDGTITPPIVGTGTFSFDDPGNGTFDFFSLTNRSLSFSFSGDTFDDGDIVTTAGTFVNITSTPGGRSLVFTGSGNGSFTGSLDFIDNTNVTETALSFGPTGFEGLYFTVDNQGNFSLLGDYEAVVIPFGVSESLGLVGVATLMGIRQAKKYYANKQQTSEA